MRRGATEANWIIWMLFAGEAALMLAFSADRAGWARRHKLELAVVILTPPMLLPGFRRFGSCGSCVCFGWCWRSSSPAAGLRVADWRVVEHQPPPRQALPRCGDAIVR
jgi:hypothetical protein